jgi:hypothetical protein
MRVEEAYLKAKELKENIDNGIEYENGYLFGCKDDDNYIGGGGHVPIVILKEDGKAVDMPYFLTHGAGKEIRSFEVSKDGKITDNNEV